MIEFLSLELFNSFRCQAKNYSTADGNLCRLRDRDLSALNRHGNELNTLAAVVREDLLYFIEPTLRNFNNQRDIAASQETAYARHLIGGDVRLLQGLNRDIRVRRLYDSHNNVAFC